MDFWELIEKRRSTRSFLNKKIEAGKLQRIFKAANRAPSAHNYQSYKIYVVDKPEIRRAIKEACMYDQEYVAKAPVLLVFVTFIESKNKTDERSKFYALNDAIIACYQSWLAAINLGLSGVWVGAFDDEKLSKVLQLKQGQRPVAILPLGYAGEIPALKSRKSLGELVVRI